MSTSVTQQNYFDLAFTNGATLPVRGEEAVITQLTIGELYLPTGCIVTCDPLTLWQADPFVQTVQPGRYLVSLSLVQFANDRWKHVALAKVAFTNRPSVSWELAVKPGQDLATLGKDEFYGYGVDTGTGAFLDAAAVTILRAKVETSYYDMVETLTNARRHPAPGAIIPLDEATGINFAAFSAGFGDGTYPSYWGYDSDGKVVSLVTDFGLLAVDDDETG